MDQVCSTTAKSNRFIFVMACALFVTGCSPGEPAGEVRAEAQQAITTGKEAMDRSQFRAAEEHFTQAIELGGTSADQAVEALINRAKARWRLHMYEAALEDLAAAEEGAVRPERIYVLRGRVYEAQGDAAAAAAEFAKARQLDPSVE